MPRSISPEAIKRLSGVIERIDAECAKSPEERRNFHLDGVEEPKRLKTHLATYKHLHRREEWNGKFELRIKPPHRLSIEFDTMAPIAFKMVDAIDEDIPVGFTISESKNPSLAEAEVQNLSDQDAAMFLIQEGPNSATFNLNLLSEETQAYVLGKGTSTAFSNVWERRGYKADIYMNRLRLHK